MVQYFLGERGGTGFLSTPQNLFHKVWDFTNHFYKETQVPGRVKTLQPHWKAAGAGPSLKPEISSTVWKLFKTSTSHELIPCRGRSKGDNLVYNQVLVCWMKRTKWKAPSPAPSTHRQGRDLGSQQPDCPFPKRGQCLWQLTWSVTTKRIQLTYTHKAVIKAWNR